MEVLSYIYVCIGQDCFSTVLEEIIFYILEFLYEKDYFRPVSSL